MRLWSLHPSYLDAPGLVALWRESLLARAVLKGETRGYIRHPQLERFKAQTDPLAAIEFYLQGIYEESLNRGYHFDARKIGPAPLCATLDVTEGQLRHEWQHLLEKIKHRDGDHYRILRAVDTPQAHPLFKIRAGNIEPWERVKKGGSVNHDQ